MKIESKTRLELFTEKFSILIDFKKYLEKEGKSKNTISSYLQSLKSFFEYCQYEEDSDFEKLDRMFITEFKGYLARAPRLCKPKTINAKLSAISEFNRFLVIKGINEKMEITKKDFVKIQQDYLSPSTLTYEEVENIRRSILLKKDKRLKKVEKSKGTQFILKKKRDYLIVTMLAFTGLRVSELIDLYLDDFLKFERGSTEGTFNEEAKLFTVRDGKGNKSRVIPMFPEIIEPLKSYIEAREEDNRIKEKEGKKIIDCPYLLTGRQNKKLDRSTINNILKEYNINPHAFRHFIATYLLNEKGFDMKEVQGILGHASLNTLSIYTHTSIDTMLSKYNSN